MKKFQPVIKWSGSKRPQAERILEHFPKTINTYYEPFIGGGSVLRALLENKDSIKVNKYVCVDNDKHLIDLWNAIKERPQEVADHYQQLWTQLNINEDKNYKKEFFYKIRQRLNEEHNPLDFMFIMRTTTNGMPRYNKDGEFNNSFHVTRDGITPDKLDDIIFDWSEILNNNKVEFLCGDYQDIEPKIGDFLYLDPPYANTKGMYGGGFDSERLYEWIRKTPCSYVWSYDGISGAENNTVEVPIDLYDEHIYIESGNSSFKRVIGKDRNAIVYESLYIKRNK